MGTHVVSNDFHINFHHLESPLLFGDIRLHQVGKMFCNPDTVIPSHTHINWFEITAILSGKGTIYTNKKSISVKEGDLFLSFPCDIHKIVSDTESPMKYSFLAFSLANDFYKQEFEDITQYFYETERRLFHNPTVELLIELLISEMTTTGYNRDKIISLYLQSVLILIIRDFLYKQVENISKYKNNDEVLCYKIMRYIDQNIFSIQNLTEVSNYFHYNYSYLAKVFKQTTKNTITQYFSNKKFEHAKLLIRQESLTFTKIADLLNFSSIYSFSKAFKSHFGVSPAEYKKNLYK